MAEKYRKYLKRICYMIFSRIEYSSIVNLLSFKEIIKVNNGHKKTQETLTIFSSMAEVTVTMYECLIFQEPTIYRLMAGPNENSIVVVMYVGTFETFIPCERITDISLEYLDFQLPFKRE